MPCPAFLKRSLPLLPLLLLAVAPLATLAQEVPVQRNRLTDTYNVGLRIGPAVRLLPGPEGAPPPPAGTELALPGPDGAPPVLPPDVDAQGRAVNHHVDLTVFVVKTGAIVVNPPPTIELVHLPDSQRFSPPLIPLQGGPAGRHFGTNVYLPDGVYNVTVNIAGEQVTFSAIALSAAAPPSATRAPLPSPLPVTATPRTLPRNGEADGPAGLAFWPAGLGLGLLGAGLLWRHARGRPR